MRCRVTPIVAQVGLIGIDVQVFCVGPHLVLSSVSPSFKANSEGASLALAMSTKCSALSGLKKRGNRYVLQRRMQASMIWRAIGCASCHNMQLQTAVSAKAANLCFSSNEQLP